MFLVLPASIREGATELIAQRIAPTDSTSYPAYTRIAFMFEAIDYQSFYGAYMYGDWTKFQEKVDEVLGNNRFQTILELGSISARSDGFFDPNDDPSAMCALLHYVERSYASSVNGTALLAQIKRDRLWTATYEPKCDGK